ncbi:MAG: small multi-drug export protein [Clostridiales bacterium]|nr:small multi-drug export protein [Clostridiales bacterium]
MSLIWQVFIMSLLPGLEMKVAIPYAFARGMTLPSAIFWGTLGTLLLTPVAVWIVWTAETLAYRYIPPLRKLFDWLARRGQRHAHWIRRYGPVGIFLFIAIPLPGSGVWTGVILGKLLQLPWNTVLFWSALGVAGAGITVGLATAGVFQAIRLVL